MLPQSLHRPYRSCSLQQLLFIYIFLLLQLQVKFTFSHPILNNEVDDLNSYRLPVAPAELFQFLRRFGYLETAPALSESLYSEDAVIEAIKNLQKFGGINQTGELSNETLGLLVAPRCGVPDVVQRSGSRRKRYVIGGQGWKKRTISYLYEKK